MAKIKRFIIMLYWFALVGLVVGGFVELAYGKGLAGIFHLAYWAPSIGMLAVISGQVDLLASIEKGNEVNIKARCLDFIHWLFLMFLNIGAWLIGGTAISWFVLKVMLLGIIGWEIGVGVNRIWHPTKSEKIAGFVAVVFSVVLGISAGYIRYLDTSEFGWGWVVESFTAIVSTLIVAWWILVDLTTISKKAIGYPRRLFLKGIFSNFLILWFWFHIMYLEGSFARGTIHQFGLTFNVIVGNLLYLFFYATYEYHHVRQKRVG